jgi:hypothetical protein
MAPSSSPALASRRWTLLAILLLAGVVLALVLGPESTPLVSPEGGQTP